MTAMWSPEAWGPLLLLLLLLLHGSGRSHEHPV